MLKTFIKILRRSLEYRWWMLLAVLMSFFTVGSGIGLMMTSSYIIASAAIQTPIYQLQVAIVGVRFFGIMRGVFRYTERYISHEVTFKVLAKLRVWFFESLEPLIPDKKNKLTSGDLLSRSIEDIENLEHIFVRVISPPLVFIAISLLMFYLLNLFNIKYSIIFVLIFYLSALGIPALTFILSKNDGKKIIELKARLKEITSETVQGLAEIVFYEYSDRIKKEFIDINGKLLKAEKKMTLIQSMHEILTGVALNVTVFVLLINAIPNVNDGTLNGVYLSVITIGIMASFEIVFQIPLVFQYFEKSVEAGDRLFNITENKISAGNNEGTIRKNIFTSTIEFKNVSFSYDDIKNILNDISFKINKNEIVAIVGKSGSGKTTISNLLLKLWKNYQGQILIDGIDYKNITDESIRELISVVTQNVHLFTGTIKENLSIAKKDFTDEEINNVLEKSMLKNMIDNLPDGINTHIGELGKKLSGGEIKRIGIARALLKNSPIIIFDEATNHLDFDTEQRIITNIQSMKNEKTIIYITHRLINKRVFDRIINLDEINKKD